MLHCMRVSCEGQADFSVKALIPACGHEFFESPPLEVYCGLRLCAACANRLKLDDFFNEEVRENVVKVMIHKHNVLPDFARSVLQIISVNDLNLLMLEAQCETIH